MENISQINKKTRYRREMKIYPYLRDHHFEGKAILPAAEALIILAEVVNLNFPRMDISCLLKARFPRFLSIDQEVNSLAVFIDIESDGEGGVAATLLTSAKSKTEKIIRIVEHARVEFSAGNYLSLPKPSFRNLEKLSGQCISVPSVTIYRELVPFGKAYQNIIGDISVSSEGALAYLSGGNNEADENKLGSPFPFDAALHMACVWGQRFTDIVPFPVGFKERIIHRKTKKGGNYLGRIVPADIKKEALIFDAWIYDLNGIMNESISGIQMRDVTQGRRHPPQWFKE